MDPITISGIIGIGGKLIDKMFPDPEQKAKAQLELVQMQQAGELEELKTELSAIISESQSADPWTSRARPCFLYVMYIMILSSIVMGVVAAVNPAVADHIANGMKAWLASIPSDLYTLFGVGYLGYTGVRTFEKKKGLSK